jgi:hypothetical protein
MTSANINALGGPYRDILDPEYVKAYDNHVGRSLLSTALFYSKTGKLTIKLVVGHILEHQVSIEEVRQRPTAFRVSFGVPESQLLEIGSTTDIQIPVADGIKISTRMYRPATTEVTPAHINFHGGGEEPECQSWTLYVAEAR